MAPGDRGYPVIKYFLPDNSRFRVICVIDANAPDSCGKDRLKCPCPGVGIESLDGPISLSDIVKRLSSPVLGPKALTSNGSVKIASMR